jgi:hypothetical protein
MLDLVPDDARPQLADASRLTESLRRQDPTYQSELRWWTSPFELDQGFPPTSRVSASEASRVDVARAFPTTGYGERRAQICPDRSKIIVLSTRGDTSLEVLRCGEALSTVLLECLADSRSDSSRHLMPRRGRHATTNVHKFMRRTCTYVVIHETSRSLRS